MKVDIAKELDHSSTLLLVMPISEYCKNTCEIVKNLSGKNVCYFTLNKTYLALQEIFKRNKVSFKNIVFVDIISKIIEDAPDQTDGAYFSNKNKLLSKINLFVEKFLRHNFDYIIFDSITDLMTYQKRKDVADLVSKIAKKVKKSKTKAVFYAINSSKKRDDFIKESVKVLGNVIYCERDSKVKKKISKT